MDLRSEFLLLMSSLLILIDPTLIYQRLQSLRGTLQRLIAWWRRTLGPTQNRCTFYKPFVFFFSFMMYVLRTLYYLVQWSGSSQRKGLTTTMEASFSRVYD